MSNTHNKNTKKLTAWDVKEPKFFKQNPVSGQVYLDPSGFDKLVESKGVRVKVFRTTYCPNVKSIDGAEHEINCDLKGCNGSGFIDTHPIETMAFAQNQSLEKLAMVEGFVDGNSVSMTFLQGIELQYFTLVELMDFTEIYFQRVKRSETHVDALKYDAKRVNVVIDKAGIEYYQCIDFELDVNGNVSWKNSRGPNSGVIYSVHYEAAVQYRATKAVHSNRFTQVKVSGGISHMKFSEEWIMTKEFLVKRKDIDGNEISPNPF